MDTEFLYENILAVKKNFHLRYSIDFIVESFQLASIPDVRLVQVQSCDIYVSLYVIQFELIKRSFAPIMGHDFFSHKG
jgi:hypothetical protein